MRHLKKMTVGNPPRVASADILGTRAFVSLLMEIVSLFSGVSQLLKGIPSGEGGGDDPADDGHDDEH